MACENENHVSTWVREGAHQAVWTVCAKALKQKIIRNAKKYPGGQCGQALKTKRRREETESNLWDDWKLELWLTSDIKQQLLLSLVWGCENDSVSKKVRSSLSEIHTCTKTFMEEITKSGTGFKIILIGGDSSWRLRWNKIACELINIETGWWYMKAYYSLGSTLGCVWNSPLRKEF